MADAIEVDLNWNFTSLAEGLGSSLSSAGESSWNSIKTMSDEGAGAVFGVLMIIIAGLVVWRVSK